MKRILVLVAVLLLIAGPAFGGVLQLRGTASNHDVKYVANTAWTIDSPELLLGTWPGSNDGDIPLVFTGVTIAQGTQIDSAVIILRNQSSTTYDIVYRIYCHDVDNSWAFSGGSSDYTDRVSTTAYASGSFSGAVTDGTDFRFAQCGSAVQEVFDRAGWASGNALCVMIKNNNSAGQSRFDSWDLAPTGNYAAYLNIYYEGAGGSDDHAWYIRKGGNDGNTGRAWETAFLTFDKIADSISAGDTVFIGAGRYNGVQINPPANGSWDHTTVYCCSTFDTDTKFDPIICSGKEITGWTVHSGNIYKAYTDQSTRGYCLTYNDSLMEPVKEEYGVAGINRAGKFWHDNVDHIYFWAPGDVDPDVGDVLFTNRPTINMYGSTFNYITFFGLDLRMGMTAVVKSEATTYLITFHYCHISRGCSSDGSNGGAIYCVGRDFDNKTNWAHNMFVHSCSLGHVGNEPKDSVNGHFTYGHIWTPYSTERPVMCSSWVYAPYGNGMYRKTDTEATVNAEGMACKFNTFEPALQCAFIQTAEIKYDSIYGCTFLATSGTAISIGGTQGDGPYGGHNFICNNTIYACPGRSIIFDDNSWNDLGDSNFVKYNILDSCIAGTTKHGFCNCSNTTYLEWTIDSNIFYDQRDWFRTDGCGASNNFATWRSSCGMDVNSPDLNSWDPQLNDPANGDVQPNNITAWSDSIYYGDRWWYHEGAWQPGTGEASDKGNANKGLIGGGIIR